jgi:secondary thiamine-phosphate synthase enzyme
MTVFEVKTSSQDDIVDITAQVQDAVRKSGVDEGVCVVFVPHTTAAVAVNECADPDVKRDILMALRKAVPDSLAYSHGEGNSPAHVKAALVGPSLSVLIAAGKLALGTWQGIFLCEFDGPRKRKVWVRVAG